MESERCKRHVHFGDPVKSFRTNISHLLANIGFRYCRGRAPRSLRIATSYQAPFPRVRTTALLTSELMRTFSPFLNWARAWWYPLRISSRTSRSPWTLPFRGPRPQEIEKDLGKARSRLDRGRVWWKETLHFLQDVSEIYLLIRIYKLCTRSPRPGLKTLRKQCSSKNSLVICYSSSQWLASSFFSKTLRYLAHRAKEREV